MAKFVIECPSCGKYTQASNFIFAKKHIDCTCGYTINVRTDKMTSRVCAHCGNNVIFDQSRGESAVCPVCKEKINTSEHIFNKVDFSCPTCSCTLSADKNAAKYTCPLCDTVIDVQAQVAKDRIKKQGLATVIKYEGPEDVFVWKYPVEDFNFGSQLIVHESQEAVFFRDGQALDLFPAGRHILETQNLPILDKVYKYPANDDTIFHSEVYFINQAVQMGIKWGTDSKVRMFDPATGLHIELGACGQFNLKVCDSRKLLIKLVGTSSIFTRDEIIDGGVPTKPAIAKFKALIMTKVKSNLVRIIKEKNINILEVDESIDIISEELRVCINEGLAEYGLVMPEFFVTSILTPDDDPNFKRLKQQHADRYLNVQQEHILKETVEAKAERQAVEAQTAARLKIIEAQGEAEAFKIKAAAEAEEMRMKGFTYQQETARKVGVGAVENMGGTSGGDLAGIAGLGVSLGAIGGVMNMTKEAMGSAGFGATSSQPPAPQGESWDCTCGNRSIIGNFCNNCGAKKPQNGWDCTCGNKNIVGNFCNNCGAKKPENSAWDCACGNKNIVGNFCNNCGAKKPEPDAAWDCECGNKGIIGKFCNNCGKGRTV